VKNSKYNRYEEMEESHLKEIYSSGEI